MSEGKGEPSMEEILASIRRIISEDGEPAGAGAGEPAAAPRAAGAMSGDVFDLVDEAPPSARGGGLDDLMNMLDDPEPARPAARGGFDDGLMSPGAADQTAARFAQLAAMAGQPQQDTYQPSRLASANPTLDELVREALKPVLREWLDYNLPPMVENMVRVEIERLASAGRRR
jgi:cell pole-organizing protein PopZ